MRCNYLLNLLICRWCREGEQKTFWWRKIKGVKSELVSGSSWKKTCFNPHQVIKRSVPRTFLYYVQLYFEESIQWFYIYITIVIQVTRLVIMYTFTIMLALTWFFFKVNVINGPCGLGLWLRLPQWFKNI